MFKKAALSFSEGSVQQGRSLFDARSVLSVREHGKKGRTPLAAFFNIPSIYYRIDGDTVEIMNLIGRQDSNEAFS